MTEEDRDLESLRLLAPNEYGKLISVFKEGHIKEIVIKLSQYINSEFIKEIINN
jgi:hypothetical protein